MRKYIYNKKVRGYLSSKVCRSTGLPRSISQIGGHMGVLSVLLFSFCWLCDRDVAADRTFSTFISSCYQILFLHLVFSIAAWVFWNLRWAESFRLPFLLFTSVDWWLSYDLHMAVPFLWAVFDTIYYLLYSTFDILFSAFRWIKTLRETFAVVCKILDLLFLCVFYQSLFPLNFVFLPRYRSRSISLTCKLM